MKRRAFLAAGGVGLAATTVAAPAIAQSQPEVKWRLASSFPKTLDTIYGGAEQLAKRVAEATDNKFQIRAFGAGELVPAFGVLDAVQNNTVEMAHTASYYFVGKDPTFTFDCTVPFGMNRRMMAAWQRQGGGQKLLQDFFDDYKVHLMPCGNTGTQMGGWFRKEIKTVDDLKGLKFRIGGWAGALLEKMGVVPQQIAAGDIYPALEKGTIDAAEWVGPYDDEKLGLFKVAKYYYYPGWWEGNASLSLYINQQQWESLPASYKAILEAASAEVDSWMMAKYDAENPAALKRLVSKGAVLRPFSNDIMSACYKTAQQLYTDTAAANPKFKKIYEPWKAFLAEQDEWFRVNEYRFDTFMFQQTQKKT